MTRPLATLVLLAGVAGIAAGCAPDRLRPGPPRVTIEVPVGSTVFSPDTLPLLVVATDPNGLDSLSVDFLGQTEIVNTFFEAEAEGIFLWPIPPGLLPGTLLTISARAKDLTGQVTTASASVTVIARSGETP